MSYDLLNTKIKKTQKVMQTYIEKKGFIKGIKNAHKM